MHARRYSQTSPQRNARAHTHANTHTAGEANYAGQLDRAATLRLKGEEITWQKRGEAEARGQARWGCPFTDKLSVYFINRLVNYC